jgi:hypothetical protein
MKSNIIHFIVSKLLRKKENNGYLLYKYSNNSHILSIKIHLTLFLVSIKLLQKKIYV